jgi:hypothetical protein
LLYQKEPVQLKERAWPIKPCKELSDGRTYTLQHPALPQPDPQCGLQCKQKERMSRSGTMHHGVCVGGHVDLREPCGTVMASQQ